MSKSIGITLEFNKARDKALGIEARALSSVQDEFKTAAIQKKKDLRPLFEVALNNPLQSMFSMQFSSFSFLTAGSENSFMATPIGFENLPSLDVWGSYLHDIGRLDGVSPNTLAVNEATVKDLITQNGPKKMEYRLGQFMKRSIKRAMR